MLIEALDVYYVRHPLKNPWRTAYGEDAEIFSTVVAMHGGGHTGWSDTSPLRLPTYSPEFAYGVYYLVSEVFAPLTVGREIDSAEMFDTLFSQFKGNPFAKSAIEIAWWILESKIRNKPLHKLFGGSDDDVSVGADFGIQDTLEELITKVGTAVDQGYPRVKLKVKKGWDYDVVRAVRETYPRLTIHIDCNSGFTLADADLFRKMDTLDLAMIEQPLFHTDIREHALLQAMIETPICLDESCNSVRAAKEALETEACRYINIKPSRVGGIRNSLLIHDMCKDADVGCWIGGMLESSVGVSMLIEMATLDNITYPNDLIPSEVFFYEEFTDHEIKLSSPGKMKPSMVPGTGYDPLPDRLQEQTIYSKHYEM